MVFRFSIILQMNLIKTQRMPKVIVSDKFIDPGEATSIALAAELEESLLIIDDLKGRKVATELGIHITGSLGVLLTAKNNGVIDSVIPIVEKIQKTNFRISDYLLLTILPF